jgi:5'(3')-deoxyribonucleotidase
MSLNPSSPVHQFPDGLPVAATDVKVNTTPCWLRYAVYGAAAAISAGFAYISVTRYRDMVHRHVPFAETKEEHEAHMEEMSKLYDCRVADPNKPTVAVDLDEVLGYFVAPLAEYHNECYGTTLTQDDFNSYLFSQVWGGTQKEGEHKVHDFFESKYFDDIPLVDGARQVLEKHLEHFNFVLVTSRQHVIEGHTRKWLQHHYPGIFCSLHFGNHFGLAGVKTSKPVMCERVGAICLIDDSLHYARQCSALDNFTVVLFGKYGWNASTEQLRDNVIRLNDWQAVDQTLGELYHKHQDHDIATLSVSQ